MRGPDGGHNGGGLKPTAEGRETRTVVPTRAMRGSLREMRMRSSVPLHGQILVTNRTRVRSETPAGETTAVALIDEEARRG